jgi:hypothetical protein
VFEWACGNTVVKSPTFYPNWLEKDAAFLPPNATSSLNASENYLIDITVRPIAANSIIDKILEREWEKDDLMAYLNTMAVNVNDYHTCEA